MKNENKNNDLNKQTNTILYFLPYLEISVNDTQYF